MLELKKTKNLNLNDPNVTRNRVEIIKNKSFLKKIYEEWYSLIINHLDSREDVLEIGSGAGFLDDFLPNLITSEVFYVDNAKLITDAQHLPFGNNTLNAIVMTDILHHIPNCNLFFREASRAIRPGGKIIMVEPWNNLWSRFIYTNFHHEPFDISRAEWAFPSHGPLSSANGGLPWILFKRDKDLFVEKFKNLTVHNIKPIMPFSYILSGGLSIVSLLPGYSYKSIRFLEKLFFENKMGMFAFIEIEVTNGK